MALSDVGYIPITADELLEDVQAVFTSTFGTGCNLSPSTINGVFIQELTDYAVTFQDEITYLYAQVYDLDVSGGVFLDGLGAWQNISREAATNSTVSCICTGLASTLIPLGSQIANTNGDLFESETDITLDGTGSGTGTFKAVSTGTISVDANTVNTIIQTVPGWTAVNNSDNGTTGSAIQSDYNYRNTVKYAQGLNSTGSIDSIRSQLYDNSEVKQFYVQENTTDASIVYALPIGVTVPAKSIYTAVYYNDDASIADPVIAAILYNKKSGGCGMAGTTTYTYTVPSQPYLPSGYTYDTQFTLVDVREVYIEINIVASTSYSSTINDDIKSAVVDNWDNGYSTANIPKVNMGTVVYASRFYASIQALGVYNIISISMCPACTCATTADITLSGEQTIDGITTNSSYVLVKNQTNETQNGIYLSNSSAWVRATDADTASEISGYQTFVLEGTVNVNTNWLANTITTIGVDNITFTSAFVTKSSISLPIDQAGNVSTNTVFVNQI